MLIKNNLKGLKFNIPSPSRHKTTKTWIAKTFCIDTIVSPIKNTFEVQLSDNTRK